MAAKIDGAERLVLSLSLLKAGQKLSLWPTLSLSPLIFSVDVYSDAQMAFFFTVSLEKTLLVTHIDTFTPGTTKKRIQNCQNKLGWSCVMCSYNETNVSRNLFGGRRLNVLGFQLKLQNVLYARGGGHVPSKTTFIKE